jgi:hypothetical protein
MCSSESFFHENKGIAEELSLSISQRLTTQSRARCRHIKVSYCFSERIKATKAARENNS